MTGDTSGDDGTLARIVTVAERTTVLRRSSDDTDPTERVVVANADTLVVVTATADPEPSWGFLDRTAVAAFDAGIRPLIAVTKTDLRSAAEVRDRFADVDVAIVVCCWGIPVWASRRSSTGWCPARTARRAR
jgi:ribosome biogenesis GTPase